ncbi:MAG: hypothetical protein R3296_01125 [Oleiphilaceae bacterium]|nr:hypothetical protein [Oleiphilaceae bacterium]
MISKSALRNRHNRPWLMALLSYQESFPHYHRLWLAFSPLEQTLDWVWSRPGAVSQRQMRTLARQIRQARKTLRRHALVLEPENREKLDLALSALAGHPALKKRLSPQLPEALVRHNTPAREEIRSVSRRLLSRLSAEISALEA